MKDYQPAVDDWVIVKTKIRGKVTEIEPSGIFRIVTKEGHSYYIGNSSVSFERTVEKIDPPEPDWKEGELAEDPKTGRRFMLVNPASPHYQWVGMLKPGENGKIWFSREEMPDTLVRLVVTRADAT